MAEVLGAVASGITLAALFKTCIEAFDLIHTAQRYEIDLKKLKLRLNIEKCRLYIWGESMGLTDMTGRSKNRPIDQIRFPEIVREILEVIVQLFHDSHKIRDKYGCRQSSMSEICASEHTVSFPSLAASFSNFTVQSKPSLQPSNVVRSVVWVIHDRKKFAELVTEIKDLVDSLRGITSPCVSVAQQQGAMKRKIASIDDAETLSLIAEVCSADHPDVAKAASDRADTISLASTTHQYVAAWTESVDIAPEDAQDKSSPDPESLTHSEILHKYRELRQALKDRETMSPQPQRQMAEPSHAYNNPRPLGTQEPISTSYQSEHYRSQNILSSDPRTLPRGQATQTVFLETYDTFIPTEEDWWSPTRPKRFLQRLQEQHPG